MLRLACRLRVKVAMDRSRVANRVRKLMDVCGHPNSGVRKARKLLEEGCLPALVEAQVRLLFALYDEYSKVLGELDRLIFREAKRLYGREYELLQSVPGVGSTSFPAS